MTDATNELEGALDDDTLDAAWVLNELTAAVRVYLATAAAHAPADPESTDFLIVAARVRRKVKRRAAEAELQRLTQLARYAETDSSEVLEKLGDLTACVSAYLLARTRERAVTQAVVSMIQPVEEELAHEATNRILWERDMRLMTRNIEADPNHT